MPPKAFASGAAPRRLAPTQEVHLRSLLSASILTFGLKFVFRRGYALDPACGAREGDTLSPFPTSSTPAAPHLELEENLLQGLRKIDTLE